jgi:ABC-2 type transport system permease protein
MNKILLIIRREFITRVRKKSFIIMTILGPLLFAGVIILPVWLVTRETSSVRIIEVDDKSGLFVNKLEGASNLEFIYVNIDQNRLVEHTLQSPHYGVLYIPKVDLDNPNNIVFFSKTNPGLDVKDNIQRMLNREIENLKLDRSGISRETLEQIRTRVSLTTNIVTDSGEKAGNTEIASIIGYISSFLIYMFIFIYGAQVMRGVLEEKTSRIVEIIISSVRPFQLMMGKIIGVASVGLTQFLLWIILTVIIVFFVRDFFGVNELQQIQEQAAVANMSADRLETAQNLQNVFEAISAVPLITIIAGFIFYFLGGYFLYGALFAAIGSASDTETDTQQFMLPITIPLIISIISLGAILKEPDGNLAFWLSMVPLTSPVVMMMRIPFVIPAWEIMLSMFLLVLGFVFTTWLAGKIYRIGVLVHGSKINYRVLWKWLFIKN